MIIVNNPATRLRPPAESDVLTYDVTASDVPASYETPAHRLRAIIRNRIISGEYRPGAWIREVELQREFSLSNGPVREALQSTVADGLAERAPFRGVRVIDLDETELAELFEVRFVLLGSAAELAAERAGADVEQRAAALKESLRNALRDGNDPDLWFAGDLSHWVFELAGNARLREAYKRPLMQSLVYVAVARKRDPDRDALLPYAFAVIDAIAQRRPSRARRAVRELTDQTLRHLQSAQRSTP
jgi:DNA-binding GntR family transcriptional regulator